MSRLIVDSAMRALLNKGTDVVEFCDDAGNVLGHFFPTVDPAQIKNPEPKITEEEIERRIHQGGGRPLSEIMAELEKRA